MPLLFLGGILQSMNTLATNICRPTRGFTLIELLVVIAIIGMLSAVVISSVSGARAKGFDARRLADIKQIQLALDLYNEYNGKYPSSLSDSSFVNSGYIPRVPKDPTTGNPYMYAGLVGTATDTSVCGAYHLGAIFQGENDPAFSTAFKGTPGGTYDYGNPPHNGPICTSSAADFQGYISGTNTVYDVRS